MNRPTNSVKKETEGAPSVFSSWSVNIHVTDRPNGGRRAIQRLKFGKNDNGLSCFILAITYIPVLTYCKEESSGMVKLLGLHGQ